MCVCEREREREREKEGGERERAIEPNDIHRPTLTTGFFVVVNMLPAKLDSHTM